MMFLHERRCSHFCPKVSFRDFFEGFFGNRVDTWHLGFDACPR